MTAYNTVGGPQQLSLEQVKVAYTSRNGRGAIYDKLHLDPQITKDIERVVSTRNLLVSDRMPDRSEVENQELTLDNLVDYLEDVIKYLQIIEDQDVVLALGVTGCGKSCIF